MRGFSVKMKESMVADIENIVAEMGLWPSESEFVREAVEDKLKSLGKEAQK